VSDRKWDESGPDVDRADASRAHDRAEKAAHQSDAGADDYAVGYRRPPKATRFQPGKSGNPAGGRKRKGSYKSLYDEFRELLAEQVTVTVGGRPERMSTRTFLLRRGISGAKKAITHPLFDEADACGSERVQARMPTITAKGFAPLSLAVSTVVRTSASASAAHMAR
jgi:hypothetical protein